MDKATNSVSADNTVSASNESDRNDSTSFNFLKDGSPRVIFVKCGFEDKQDD
jgi:hypothetical protein